MDRSERLILLEAWWLHLVVTVGLIVLPFPRLLALARRPHRAGAERPLPCPVRRIARLVEIAGACAPRPARCLGHALVLSWLLARRGVTTRLVIGVARSDGELVAHAWVELAGSGQTMDAVDGRYMPIVKLGEAAG